MNRNENNNPKYVAEATCALRHRMCKVEEMHTLNEDSFVLSSC